MADSGRPAKAQLIEMDDKFDQPKSGGKNTTVQFNPETLKVSFANQIVPPNNASSPRSGTTGAARDQNGGASQQFVGAGTTKLSLQLWFDVGAQLPDNPNPVKDVRELTKNVAYFITPQKDGEQYVPPAVRFHWGSFTFDGIMESVEESLEFFSNDGLPLRASMAINMSQQRIQAFHGEPGRLNIPTAAKTPGGAPLGTGPLTQAPAGASVQSLASNARQGVSWQTIATANGIENPRLLQPGQFIDLNVRR